MSSNTKSKKSKKKTTANPANAPVPVVPPSTHQYGPPVVFGPPPPQLQYVQPPVFPMPPGAVPAPGTALTVTHYPGYPGPPPMGVQPVPVMAGPVPHNVPGPAQPGPGPRPTRPQQLEFNKAMSDFQGMFPKLDRNVIETVLRSNDGKVDETIDQLLRLNIDVPDSAPERPPVPSNQPFATSQPPQQIPPRSLPDEPPPYSPPRPNSHYVNQDDSSEIQQNISRGIQERLNANRNRRQSVGREDAESCQILEDERIALFLQNDEFLRQLQHNPEFMSALESDYEEALNQRASTLPTPPQSSAQSPKPVTSPSARSHPPTPTLSPPPFRTSAVDMSSRPLPSTPGPELPARPRRNSRSATLEHQQQGLMSGGSPSPHGPGPGSRDRAASAGAADSMMGDAEFRNKLPHMGKSSKTTLSFLAGKFAKKKKAAQKYQVGGGSPHDRLYEELPDCEHHEYMTRLDFNDSSC